MADPNQVAGIRRAGEVERRFAFVFPLPTALLPFYFFSFGGNTFFSLPKKNIYSNANLTHFLVCVNVAKTNKKAK
jgi:hypothetical protein